MKVLLTFMFLVSNLGLVFFGNLSYFMGCDVLSYGLILLSLWICSLMLMASESTFRLKNYEGLFLFTVIMLLIFLYLTFSTMHFFMFYLSFESSLIPTLWPGLTHDTVYL